MNELLDQLIKI